MSYADELIARIAVEGVDGFVSGITSAEVALGELAAKAVEAGFSLVEHLGKAFIDVTVEAGRAFLDFARDSVAEAGKVELMSASLAGFAGSAKTAAEMITFLRQEGERGVPFTFDQLLKGSKQIAAAGLEPRHFIRTLEQMTIAGAGGGGEGDMMMAARVLEAVASGNTPTSRQLGHFGITKGDTQGIDFKHGDVEENLEKFSKLAERKFGKALENAINTLPGHFSNVIESWQHLLSEFGEGLAPFLTRIADAVAPMLEFLAHSGKIKEIAESFAHVTDRLLGVGDGQGLQRLIAYIVVAIGRIPEIIRLAWDYGKGLLEGLGKWFGAFLRVAVEGFSRFLEGLHSLGPVIDKFGNVLEQMSRHAAIIKFAFNSVIGTLGEAPWDHAAGQKRRDAELASDLMEAMKKPDFNKDKALSFPNMENFLTSLPRVGDFFAGISKDTDALMRSFKNDPGIGKPGNPADYAMFLPGHEEKQVEANQHLKQISHNTASMADFKRFALGGGDRGAIGVTPSEFYGSRRNGKIQVDVSGASGKLQEFFQELFVDALGQAQRNGLLDGMH